MTIGSIETVTMSIGGIGTGMMRMTIEISQSESS